MKRILWYLWMLPQNLIGLSIKLLFAKRILVKINNTKKGVQLIFIDGFHGAVSLGEYLIFNHLYVYDKGTHAHEYGHYLQGRIFGPLYLLVIGLPSIIRAGIDKYILKNKWDIVKRHKWYHSHYPENWANKLGEGYSK